MEQRPYGRQNKGFGIGNFIMTTPALQTLSEHLGSKVGVYFEEWSPKQLFLNCPFIEILDASPDYPEIVGSNMINYEIPDWQHIHQLMTTKLGISVDVIPHTYVDRYERPGTIPDGPYALILRGCIYADDKIAAKDPGDAIYHYAIERLVKTHQIVFTGNDLDYERWTRRMANWCDHTKLRNSIPDTLGAIEHADLIVSNDTGVCHAAGALNSKVLVFWKDTRFEKNRSPGKRTTVSFKGNWRQDFDAWLGG